MVHVPYKGPAMTDLLGGVVDIYITAAFGGCPPEEWCGEGLGHGGTRATSDAA